MDLAKLIGIKIRDFKRKPFDTFLNLIMIIFIIVFAVIIIYQLFLKIMGHSPEEIEIIKNLVYLLLGLVVRNTYFLGKIQGKLNSM